MPVFTVGVGKERLTRDVQVTRVETPRRVLKGASLVVDVVVTQTGYAGAKVPLIVEDDGRIVSTQDITLPGDGESQTVQGAVQGDDAGAARCSGSACRCRRTRKSRRTTSATRSSTSTTGARRFSISKASRGPSRSSSGWRPRRTTTCRSCCLQRTAEATVNAAGQVPAGVGCRLAEELQDGFPPTREELFTYRGDHPRQRRGLGVHARAAAHARGLRGRARRRPARARRPAIVQRRRLGRHAAGRRAAGRCSTPRARSR